MEITYRHEELSCSGDYSADPTKSYMGKMGGQMGIKGRDYFKAADEYFPEVYKRRPYQ
jgi:hypothetical protein